MARPRPSVLPEAIRLDGRKLEGGGQLVRIAVALSALTGQAITIDHIRGNRSGKQGLKASHLAAIQTLGELSGSSLVKAQVGSCSLGFHPPREQEHPRQTDSDINIRLPTPGSVFLVFQALYPYLLHSASAERIFLSIVGGTNVSSSPSYDYVAQVLIPNFARVGLPPIDVRLEKRGWSSGPANLGLGKVVFAIDTLRRGSGGAPSHEVPSIDLRKYRRGTISQIDITILAPDDRLEGAEEPQRARQSKHNEIDGDELDKPETVREYMERQVHRKLRKRLKELPRSIFSDSSSADPDDAKSHVVSIKTHTTESTHRRSCMYLLIVGHTSTGFKIGRDALYGSLGDGPKPKKPKKGQNRPNEDTAARVNKLVDQCVENFAQELYDPELQVEQHEKAQHQPCVDEYMRDQLVVFEALGKVARSEGEQERASREDERYWSLHTKTAQWVCQQMLGEDCIT
ncbi:RNA 3'-terminal phosphate cyclase/enolpyruvate transferase [Aspergillus karnatakaensis]|uniref:putative RNA 3'-terminal phosphate cyclase n=1 Tax=Aspergillus karnatakaensis TaxID=1810916 RepID=UPI003CCCE413